MALKGRNNQHMGSTKSWRKCDLPRNFRTPGRPLRAGVESRGQNTEDLENHSKVTLGGHQQRKDIIKFNWCSTEIQFKREKAEASRVVGRRAQRQEMKAAPGKWQCR